MVFLNSSFLLLININLLILALILSEFKINMICSSIFSLVEPKSHEFYRCLVIDFFCVCLYSLPKNPPSTDSHIWSWFKRSFTNSVRLIKSTEFTQSAPLSDVHCRKRGRRKGDKPRENSGCHDIHLCKNSWVWDFLDLYFGSRG